MQLKNRAQKEKEEYYLSRANWEDADPLYFHIIDLFKLSIFLPNF